MESEISCVHVTLEELKLATFTEKDVLRNSYIENLDLSLKKLQELKAEFNPELSQKLEKQLSEAENEVFSLRQQMDIAKASQSESELCSAKELLQKMVEEETGMRSFIESLRMEIENAKKELSGVMEKEAETETIAENLQVKLSKVRMELDAAVAKEGKAKGEFQELVMTVQVIVLETEIASNEAEAMMKKAKELRKETESTQIVLHEAEQQLAIALDESEEAKLAEASALDQTKSAARASISDDHFTVTMSRKEIEILRSKVEGYNLLAEMKLAAALAQIEAIKASENEAVKKVERMMKGIEDVKSEIRWR